MRAIESILVAICYLGYLALIAVLAIFVSHWAVLLPLVWSPNIEINTGGKKRKGTKK